MYTKLANSILTSTVWMESTETRIVWLTLLAMCDKNGEVQASIPGLANVARVPISACETAIELFLSPDPYSRTKSDEGRRLEEIDGGWFVINHEKYRDLASADDVKRKAAERQRRYRERQKRNGKSVTECVTNVTLCDKSHQFSHTNTNANANTNAFIDKKYIANAQFDLFWEAYPSGRKTQKQAAKKLFAKITKTIDSELLIAAAKEYAASDVGQGEYVKGPVPWLNGGCWDDDRAAWSNVKPNTPPKSIYRDLTKDLG